MKRDWLLLVVFIIFSLLFFTHSSLVSAQTLTIIGANLEAYQPPTASTCNINVPSQYPTIQLGINAANTGDINQNNDAAALNSLQAFINAVEAQSGNKLTVEQANALIQDAQEIINHI